MPNLASALKAETQRLARKEVKAQTAAMKKASSQHRRDIAALKRQIADLTREISYLRRQDKKRVSAPVNEDAHANLRFSPAWVRKHRERIELSAADYAELVGVSALTIYNWEKGKTRPRSAQLAAWAKIRDLGKREAWKRLDEMNA